MRKTITIGNPEGVGKKYSVEIGSSSYAGSQMFIVNDVFSEQEALDAAVDYCEEHGWDGLFWDNEEIAQEYPDDYITAGNHGHLLPSDQVIVHSLNESKKQTIKINEGQLKKIVAESVKKILKEGSVSGYGDAVRSTYETIARLYNMWDKLRFQYGNADVENKISSALFNVLQTIEQVDKDALDGNEEKGYSPYSLKQDLY